MLRTLRSRTGFVSLVTKKKSPRTNSASMQSMTQARANETKNGENLSIGLLVVTSDGR